MYIYYLIIGFYVPFVNPSETAFTELILRVKVLGGDAKIFECKDLSTDVPSPEFCYLVVYVSSPTTIYMYICQLLLDRKALRNLRMIARTCFKRDVVKFFDALSR